MAHDVRVFPACVARGGLLHANRRQVKQLVDEGTNVLTSNIRLLNENFDQLRERIKELHAKDPSHRGAYMAQVTREMKKAGVRFDEPEGRLSLDKSWHAMHYLLTGRADEAPPPLGNAILGGTPLGPDLGYGPARLLSPTEVQETAVALSMVRAGDLDKQCNLAAMKAAQVYACNEQNDLVLAKDYFGKLKALYGKAAKRQHGMLLYLA